MRTLSLLLLLGCSLELPSVPPDDATVADLELTADRAVPADVGAAPIADANVPDAAAPPPDAAPRPDLPPEGPCDEGDLHGCGTYVAAHCRAWIGFGKEGTGPSTPSPTWGRCPGEDRWDPPAGLVHCAGSTGDLFRSIHFAGFAVDHADRFAVALTCEDPNSPVAAWVERRCAFYFGQADVGSGDALEGSESWGACPRTDDPDGRPTRCISSGHDGQFHAMYFLGTVDENDAFGVAFRCEDPARPERAALAQRAVSVWLAWFDRVEFLTDPEPDAVATWGECPGVPLDDTGDRRCASTRGDGRFHRFRLGGEADGADMVGIALTRARP